MVTALLRDQDKVLLLAHTFHMEHEEDSVAVTLLPLGPLLGLPAGVMVWLGCSGQILLPWTLQSRLQHSSRDYAGEWSLYFWLDLSL